MTDTEQLKQTVTRIPTPLHRQLKKRAADEATTMQQLVTKALQHYVAQHRTS